MNKNLYEACKNVSYDIISDFLEKEAKECYIDALLNPSFQGSVHVIYLDEQGDISITGVMSNNSMLMGEYEGNLLRVATIEAYQEIDFDVVDWDNIEALSEDEKKTLFEKLQDDLEIEELKETAIEDGDEFDLEYCFDNNRFIVESYFRELFEETYDEILKTFLEFCWDSESDRLLDTINFNIDNYINIYQEYDETIE